MKTYKFTGDGAGVPGLPHEIPEEQARAYGELFQSALEAGLYTLESVGVATETPQASRVESAPRKSKKADDTPAQGD